MSAAKTVWLSSVAVWALMVFSVVAQPPPGPRRGGAPPTRMQIDRDIEFSRVGGRSLSPEFT